MVDEGVSSGAVCCGCLATGAVVEAVRLTQLLDRVDWRDDAWIEELVFVDRGMQARRGCIALMIVLGGIFV